MSHTAKVLVVEDDRHLRDALVSTLETAGYDVLSAEEGGAALEVVGHARVDLVVTDVEMKPMNGRELLRRLRATRPELPVLMMTAYGTIERGVGAMRDGAADYLVKPFEADELERRVARYVRPAAGVRSETTAERAGPVANDARSRALLELARRVASSEVTVLLTGESGTGKEVLARYIHASSKRGKGPFVAVNCAAIPEQMLEALLFGHEKGAFTGAQARSDGKFVQANGGTLLLDEITEMQLGLQAKLLRVLQEREVEPLGASRPVALDVRVVATSNRDLEHTVRAGQFREDLYYRLSVFPLRLPALRERPGDIAALAQRFVAERSHPASSYRLSDAALAALERYDWPGNVRELENVVQRALVLAGSEPILEPRHLLLGNGCTGTGENRIGVASGPMERGSGSIVSAAETTGMAFDAVRGAASTGLAGEMWETEARRIVSALEAHRGGRKRAAAQLGISDRTLRYKLAKIRAAGIDVPGDRAHGVA